MVWTFVVEVPTTGTIVEVVPDIPQQRVQQSTKEQIFDASCRTSWTSIVVILRASEQIVEPSLPQGVEESVEVVKIIPRASGGSCLQCAQQRVQQSTKGQIVEVSMLVEERSVEVVQIFPREAYHGGYGRTELRCCNACVCFLAEVVETCSVSLFRAG